MLLIYSIDMHIESNKCPELTELTVKALNNEALRDLFISTQKNNLSLCIKYTIQ